MCDQVWWAKVSVDPAFSELVPSVFGRYVLQPSASLVTGSFVNDVEDWVAVDVHDININAVVELCIVSQRKSESTWGGAVFLAVCAVLGQVLENLLIDIMASTF
jgi:hypothetical protein